MATKHSPPPFRFRRPVEDNTRKASNETTNLTGCGNKLVRTAVLTQQKWKNLYAKKERGVRHLQARPEQFPQKTASLRFSRYGFLVCVFPRTNYKELFFDAMMKGANDTAVCADQSRRNTQGRVTTRDAQKVEAHGDSETPSKPPRVSRALFIGVFACHCLLASFA